MKKGLVVSDTQCGSIYGMLPPAFETSEGIVKPQNAGQTYLWNCWEDFTQRACIFDPDFVIFNGDAIDGPQPKQKATELSLTLLQDQERAAVETLLFLKRRVPKAKWYFTQGTAYHVGVSAEHEEHVAQALGAERYWSLGTGRFVREILWLNIEGVIIEAAHHIGVTQGFYRLTQLDKEMQWSAMAAKDNTKGVPKADLIIRSHVHNFQLAEHASKQGLVTPCWQLQTKFMRKNSTYRMLPDIGGILLEVDGEAKKDKRAPCRIHKELYSLPPVKVTEL